MIAGEVHLDADVAVFLVDTKKAQVDPWMRSLPDGRLHILDCVQLLLAEDATTVEEIVTGVERADVLMSVSTGEKDKFEDLVSDFLWQSRKINALYGGWRSETTSETGCRLLEFGLELGPSTRALHKHSVVGIVVDIILHFMILNALSRGREQTSLVIGCGATWI